MKTGTPPFVFEAGRDPDAEDFRAEVLGGLCRPVKELPCNLFYDDRGSRLFEAICELDEYYPTRTELEIMRRHGREMAARLGPQCLLIELGSGSSLKTRLLLNHLSEPAAYMPIDISRTQLEDSAERLAAEYPDLEVLPVFADFTRPLELPEAARPAGRRAVYFPGSTIGNFEPAEAVMLLSRIRDLCGPGGGLLVGVDLEKDPHVLERAYNDGRGVTAEFNLNLLHRINRELDADFRTDRFRHLAFYNRTEGRIEMHLVSRTLQTVRIGGVRIALADGEGIRTEYSYKYTVDRFRDLAAAAGFALRDLWQDDQHLFSVQYFLAC